VVTGIVGVLATVLALRSRSYRRLSRAFAGPGEGGGGGVDGLADPEAGGAARDASPQQA
jgi:hypothetical protein